MENYKQVDRKFLQTMNNLRGMIELGERQSVPNMIRAENWDLVVNVLSGMDRKISSDKDYVQSVIDSGGAKDGKGVGLDWERNTNITKAK